MSWIDQAPYPYHLPVARTLHEELVGTFYEPGEVRDLVRRAGAPKWTEIDFKGSVSRVWSNTLDRAAREGVLRNLLTFVVDEGGVPRGLDLFLRTLLRDETPPASPVPTAADVPAFVDTVSVPEAKLFGDDLSEPVAEIAGLLASIERVMRWRSAVCRLRVTTASGSVYAGTGTLLTGDRVLTNHHVLFPDGNAPVEVVAEFNAELDLAGQQVASVVARGDLASIASNSADDWGIIGVAGAPGDAVRLDLDAHRAVAVDRERAYILQHPRGEAKRLAFVRNRVSGVEATRVYYLTDTDQGSSGAPVFNGAGQMIALHCRGGVPHKLAGLPVVKKNEGIRIDAIAPNVRGT